MDDFDKIGKLLQAGKATEIKTETQELLDKGIDPKTILEDGLMPAMATIGELFKENKIFVPEMLIAARAMNASINVLKPLMVEGAMSGKGTVVLGTVKGDLHDIGKNLVRIMMEGKGLNVIDLGVDISPEKFVQAAQEHNAQLIACSALLTTTMQAMADVVSAFKEAGLYDRVGIMVGGAPVTQGFCDTIGAHIYSNNAASAADDALAFIGS
ncbi:MAG: corrinoid protein [Spirochaetaceae bacterium]|nr:corrinoid protein [Spirochaetaceae bacterium]